MGEIASAGHKNLFLLGLSLGQQIAQGWGSRVLLMSVMYERFVGMLDDSIMVMPDAFMHTYHSYDLFPPALSLPAESFWTNFNLTSAKAVIPTLRAELLGPWPLDAEPLNGRWLEHDSTKALGYQSLAGCWTGVDEFLWRMFETALTKFQKPFNDYIGVHVRGGDKDTEGRIVDLGTAMRIVQTTPVWENMMKIFIATDDANVLSQDVAQINPPHAPGDCPLYSDGCFKIHDRTMCLSRRDGREELLELEGFPVYREPCVWCDSAHGCMTGNPCEPQAYLKGKGEVNVSQGKCCDQYEWKWNEFHRHPGGEPDTCQNGICQHARDSRAIQAALDDTMGLAHASVLVGNFKSNFFKLPWILNYLRRTPEQRQEPWCWDVFANRTCHNRHEFVVDFWRKAMQSGVPFLPAIENSELLVQCKRPVPESHEGATSALSI